MTAPEGPGSTRSEAPHSSSASDSTDRPRPSGPPSDRGGDRGGSSRGAWTVKSRLRAASRKKARKGKKKGMFQRRKVCRFCADKTAVLDYKEAKTLRLFCSETGKITPRRISGTCSKHQRKLATEIKRARHIALLPYAAGHM
ncbi:MAG: 30S ribosomal protein S18 [Deltaproteobacteria bacterium]|jgi:small subunit ribosomal protein S18|nr:30S ribosomal protein S18 [Deltaproteobacteria bacterium]